MITDFNQVNALLRQGIDICKGCEFEHYASCINERLPICSKQYDRYNSDKFYSTTHTFCEWKAVRKNKQL